MLTNHSGRRLPPSIHKPLALKPMLCAMLWAISYNTFAESQSLDLDTIPVTGNPLGVSSDELVTPVTVLNGQSLMMRRESTLGETLNSLPGVSATQFGPNASRPVIRGLDAERVRIMQNGVGVLDASSLSFDHAVAVDPLIVEQIDVIRGPAALLYGGSAIGGVVNAIDHRIPKEKLEGVIGRTEASFGGPSDARNAAAVVDAGNGQFAVHVDVFQRKTEDMDIPGYAVSRIKNRSDGTPRENKGKLVNSSAEQDGAALGAALTFEQGYLGLSYSTLDNNYGTVAEEEVRIDMQSDRLELAGELQEIDSLINRVKFRMARTDYQHVELEGTEIGTTFKNKGYEGTLEAGHQPIAGLNGVLGYQFGNTEFAALGDEAFVPNVDTEYHALYIYEELPLGDSGNHKLSFGGRTGQTHVDSQSNPNFGAGQQNTFNPSSFAIGGLFSLSPTWSLATNWSHNERAPSYFELYANGAHLATGQFEIGNSQFDEERSNGIDAQLRWKSGQHQFSLGAYYTRFSNFIGLFNTGNVDLGSGLPIAQFEAVPAIFKGVEADGKFALTDTLDLLVRGDYVHAKEKDNNSYLPRISPLRIGGGLQYHHTAFDARLDILHAFKQRKVAENELPTDRYTNVSASISYRLPVKYQIQLYAKANNLLNEEIRDHTSFLKDISPAGERSLLVGLHADF